jgi:predicted O-linked N-acetylglucosamine transferase (SPINDLY family)
VSDIPPTLESAKQHHLSGNLPQAEAIYRQLLEADPNRGDLWYYLGRAILPQGKVEEAIACYRRAIALRPRFPEAYSNLGLALKSQGKRDDATACFRHAINLQPQYLEAHLNLANLLESQGDSAAAIEAYRYVIKHRPEFAEAHNNLGLALKHQRDWGAAVARLREATRLDPNFAEAHANLASVLAELRQDDDAFASFNRALELKPNLILALCGRVNLWVHREEFDTALSALEQAIPLQPHSADLHRSLAFILCELGLISSGIEHYQTSLKLDPGSASTWSNYLYHLNYSPEVDPVTLLEEHRKGAGTLPTPRSSNAFAALDSIHGRPIRVGYISPDFRRHAVASFLMPILANHNSKAFHAYCYSDVATPDATTALLRSHAHAWRNIRPLTDDAVEQLIRSDRIDLLVDLAGHTARNRLEVFARKPAPVQLTYLGYPATTGLATIDGIITDPFIDPPGEPSHSTEQPLRLPTIFCCFNPPENAPEVSPPPLIQNGFPTFGSLHKLPKLNNAVIDLWSKLLLAIPGARLLLVRDRLKGRRGPELLAQFEANGVPPGRVIIQHDWTMNQHWNIYASIDVSLDVFPWSGHTTACESLWMGVPIITLTGHTRPSRMTASVLSAVGLPELIADTPDHYLQIATSILQNPDRLAAQRAQCRQRIQNSPLCDARSFTRDLEQACATFVAQHWPSTT